MWELVFAIGISYANSPTQWKVEKYEGQESCQKALSTMVVINPTVKDSNAYNVVAYCRPKQEK